MIDRSFRKASKAALLLVASMAAGVIGAELMVRLLGLQPHVQIVRNQGRVRLFEIDGTVVWEQSRDRQRFDCPSIDALGTETVMFFGDSIFYGTGIAAEKTFSSILQKRLDAAGRRACVLNLSQPGFPFGPKFALAKRLVPLHEPAVVYWEIWDSEPTSFTMLGGTAYNLTDFELGPDGYPATFPFPPALNRRLFETSRVYEYFTLGMASKKTVDSAHRWKEYVGERLSKVVELTRQARAELVLVLCPPLDREFTEFLSEPRESRSIVTEFASKHSVPVIRLEEAFAALDYREVRLDPCCHYNEAGHEALAEVFNRKTVEILDRRAGAAPSLPKGGETW
ncbi:MAG: hypothetical protein HY897_10970 [Deltaproteobacteria bacterium]|nr:hypothetical protein [Deltaproteobacteria bacterium]